MGPENEVNDKSHMERFALWQRTLADQMDNYDPQREAFNEHSLTFALAQHNSRGKLELPA